MAINLLFTCSKFVFNPFLFSIFLYLILIPSRKKDIQLLPLCGSLIFGYQWGLLVIITVQIFTLFVKVKPQWTHRILCLYLAMASAPPVSEFLGMTFAMIYPFSDLTLNLICLVPEALLCLGLYSLMSNYQPIINGIRIELSKNLQFFRTVCWILWGLMIIDYSLILASMKIEGKAFIIFVFVYLFTFVLLIINFMLMIIQNHQLTETKVRNAETKQIFAYTDQLEAANLSLRKNRHDYRNSLLALDGYLHDADIVGAKSYLRELIDYHNDLHSATHALITSLANLKVKPLKYLILPKLIQAQHRGVKVTVEINKELTEIPGNLVDLTRCLGILLDNALQACISQPSPQLNLIVNRYGNGACSITVQNTINQQLNLKQIFVPGITNKANHAGLGLANLQEIVDHNSDFSLSIRQDSQTIAFELLLQKG